MIGVNLLIVLGFCVYAAASFHLCPEHSTYNLCTDSCAKTCKNPKPKKPCELTCSGPGDCICDPGYYKHKDKCVLWHKCPRRYRKKYGSTISSDCDDNDSCDYSSDKSSHRSKSKDSSSDSCESWDSKACSDESKSSEDKSRCCKSKSKSKSKSTKSTKSTESSESKEKCGPNEKYGKCKQKCPETCKSKKPSSCDNKCHKKGCQCKDGFVRDKYDNCIPKGLCSSSKNCGKNEKWSNETSVPTPTCQNFSCLDKLPSYCASFPTTNGGCVCKSGYVRNKNGNCVSPDDCNKSSSKDSDSRDKSTRSKSKSKSKDSGSDSCESWDSKACSDESKSSEDKSRCCKSKSKSKDSDSDSDSYSCESWDLKYCSDETYSTEHKRRCCKSKSSDKSHRSSEKSRHSSDKSRRSSDKSRRHHRKRYRHKNRHDDCNDWDCLFKK